MVARLLQYVLIICLAFCFSCKKLSPKIDIPAYISIPYYNVNYTGTYANGGPGTANHKFTDVDVSVNGTNIGIFPLPAKIPIQQSGSNRVSIKPVIKVNGVATVRTDYSPMQLIDTVLTLEEGKLTEFIPTFDYYHSGVIFYWVESFDVFGSSVVGDSAIHVQSAEKFEGSKAMEVELRNGQTKCIGHSSTTFPLPTSSQMLYLEVNYKCNQKFTVGLAAPGFAEYREVGGANASADWNKIYFFLTPAASGLPTYTSYYVYFKFESDGTVQNDNPRLFLDNIKVVGQP
jgi:hypothetical protein